jgi:hypothetical protein
MRSISLGVASIVLLAITGLPASALQMVGEQTKPKSEAQLNIESRIEETNTSLEMFEQLCDTIRGEFAQLSNHERELADKISMAEKELEAQALFAGSLDELRASLIARRVDLMIDLAGLNARKDAYLQHKNSRELEAPSQPNELSELEKKELELAEAKFERATTLHRQGLISSTEVKEAEVEVIRLKHRMLMKAPDANRDSGYLERQLGDVVWQIVDKSAQLRAVEELLQKSVKASDVAVQLERLKEELSQLRKSRIQGWSKALGEFETTTAQHKAFLFQLQYELKHGNLVDK